MFIIAGTAVKKILYCGYGVIGTGLYLFLRLFLPLLKHLGPRYSYGLEQRLGLYDQVALSPTGHARLWFHASSVGEVRAALIVLDALLRREPDLDVVLTTTTEQGNRVARSRLPDDIPCLLAPLDVPLVVNRAIRKIAPDLYICLETELWPAMLKRAQACGVAAVLLNGRLSERSFQRYLHVAPLIGQLLQSFHRIATVSGDDAGRFIGLGAEASRVQVCGNVKIASQKKDTAQASRYYRKQLQAEAEQIFLCGSTHSGEEALLLQVYKKIAIQRPLLWMIAPRHLERTREVASLLTAAGLPFHLYSSLKKGERRRHSVVIVDTMGELAELYSVGDYNFCGGSLVERGGHNIIEAVQWGRPVFYGPHMHDFKNEAGMLEAAGCGIPVADGEHLAVLLLEYTPESEAYQRACGHAAELFLRGAEVVDKQVDLVIELLTYSRPPVQSGVSPDHISNLS